MYKIFNKKPILTHMEHIVGLTYLATISLLLCVYMYTDQLLTSLKLPINAVKVVWKHLYRSLLLHT